MTGDEPMTECADSTVLRAHLDEPGPQLDAHLDACPSCSGLLRSVAEDAGYTRRSLALLDRDGEEAAAVDVDAALSVVLSEITVTPPVHIGPNRRSRLSSVSRRLLISGAAALVALVVTLTPSGRSAVAEMLDAFRGESLQVVTIDTAAWAAAVNPNDVRALESLGDLDISDLGEPVEVADVVEAESVAGITAPALTEVPDRVVALAPSTVRLELASRDGNDVPADLDGAVLVVDVPGAIGAFFGTEDGDARVAVGRSGPLMISAEGASLETIRSFVLSREELPADLRAQLAAIDDWRSTIPVPVSVDGPGWEEVDVAGKPAIAFGDDSGIGALVIRQDADGVTVVAGQIGVSEALELAAGA